MNLLKYVYIITGSAESSAFIWVNEFMLHLQHCSNQPHFKPALQAIALGRSETQNEFDVTPLKKDNLSNSLRRIFKLEKVGVLGKVVKPLGWWRASTLIKSSVCIYGSMWHVHTIHFLWLLQRKSSPKNTKKLSTPKQRNLNPRQKTNRFVT
jgi:hypothetical protein